MKKTIFDLNHKDGKKVEEELMKTSYGKSYMIISITGIVFMFTLTICNVIANIIDKADIIISDIDVALLIVSFLLFLICRLKWMDLIKKYYDEKVTKEMEK